MNPLNNIVWLNYLLIIVIFILTFFRKEKNVLSYKQKVSLVMLAIGDFMSVCSMSIISPFYPAVSAEKGVPGSVSGLIFAVYALVMFLTSPVFGKIVSTE